MDPLARTAHDQSGQASVEIVAAVPFVLLLGAVAWQFALAGHALWLTAHAARVAARADAVGQDVETAARSALPGHLERGLRVQRLRGGGVRVRVGLPLFVGGAAPIEATSSLGRGSG